MNPFITWSHIFLVATLSFSNIRATAQNKPNIIVIYTDDQGYADLGVQDIVDDVKTPNIDHLAASGVRMTSGYVTAPQCIPSRAGLLAGRYQQRFGVDHNGTIPMPLNEVLLPELMAKAGYITGMTGKWHLEPNHQQPEWIKENIPEIKDKKKYVPSDIPRKKKMPYFPPARGFQEYYYGPMYNILANYDLEGNDLEQQWLETKGYRLDNQTDAALSFIERNHDKPFFFYLAYFAPHVPLEATEKYLSRFPGKMAERRRYCLAMLSAIDDGVGEIVETLKKYNIDENTMIFFISDNGAPLKISKEDLPGKGPGWDGSLNDPWVGEKGMISEGGIRVPYIVSWPAVLPKGKVYDEPVISLDVAATAVAVADLDTAKELDGTNLIPYLTGEKKGQPHEALYWRFWDQSAVRMGKWKFLKAGSREFLFDLSSELHEKNNLIDRHPEKVKSMKVALQKWASELENPGVPDGELKREKAWYDHYFSGSTNPSPFPQPDAGDEKEFTSIFDGKTLTGWEGDPVYWKVENGNIVGEVTPETLLERNSFLIWRDGAPADFELKLEYKVSTEGNSGINYRSEEVEGIPFALKGYQCDIDGKMQWTGQNYEERGRTFLALRGQVSKINEGEKPAVIGSVGEKDELSGFVRKEDWNECHIIVRGNVMIHLINGHVMSVVVDDDTENRTQKGLIGVQVHVGPPMKIEYRNIRLKTM